MAVASKRIVVEGEVNLGVALDYKYFPTAPDWMGRRIEHYLLPFDQDRQVSISKDGLVNGFGIFGAPGTGKSHLVLHILRSVINDVQPDEKRKFGGLILDPKAGMLDDVTSMWPEFGPHRTGDLVILRPDLLNELANARERDDVTTAVLPAVVAADHPTGVNVVDCALSPVELGRILVLAAQSAGVSAKEPFWFLAWSNLFSAALTLLEYTSDYVPTLRELLDTILLPPSDQPAREVPTAGRRGGAGTRRERGIEVLAQFVREREDRCVERAHDYLGLPEAQIRSELRAATTQIESFFESDYVRTIEAFITNAFGGFQLHKFGCLSQRSRRLSRKDADARREVSFYDQIIELGKIVLVSVGPQDPTMGKVLCTLVKCLFQQSVMSRLERHNAGTLRNFERPIFIACDEYAEVASEVPGQPVGDGRFFSLARQNGCMGILATQSIHTLANSSLSESWRSIFSNMAAKIFMGAADNETAEQASQLAGHLDWEMTSASQSHGRDSSYSRQESFQQRGELPPYVITHVLKQGQAVAIGSLDGRHTPPELRFFAVPAKGTKQTAPVVTAPASEAAGAGS